MCDQCEGYKKDSEKKSLRLELYSCCFYIYYHLLIKIIKKEIDEAQSKKLIKEMKKIVVPDEIFSEQNRDDGSKFGTIEYYNERMRLLKEFKDVNNL
jgi:hypothetical protein